MTTYEKFIESKIKIANDTILSEYHMYVINYHDNPEYYNNNFNLENSEKWFTSYFVDYLKYMMNYDDVDFDFEYFNSDPKYKRQICDDYYNGQYHEDDDEDTEKDEWSPNENALRATIRYARNDKNDAISISFFNAYLDNLTFEDFKTLLYENGIYNDIFTDQIDLK